MLGTAAGSNRVTQTCLAHPRRPTCRSRPTRGASAATPVWLWTTPAPHRGAKTTKVHMGALNLCQSAECPLDVRICPVCSTAQLTAPARERDRRHERRTVAGEHGPGCEPHSTSAGARSHRRTATSAAVGCRVCVACRASVVRLDWCARCALYTRWWRRAVVLDANGLPVYRALHVNHSTTVKLAGAT